MTDDIIDFEKEKSKRTIFRVMKDKDNPYVQINKTVLNDHRLSWKAKGLHVYMLSMPDNWQFHRDELIEHSTDQMASLKSAIAELEEFGYLEIGNERTEGKISGWHTTVFETPALNPCVVDNTRSRFSTSGEKPNDSAGLTRSRFSTSRNSTSRKSTPTKNELNNIDINKKQQQHAAAVELEELLKDKKNIILIDNWIELHGNDWQKGLWQESKRYATHSPVGYFRVLLKEKTAPSKDLVAKTRYETPSETLAKINKLKLTEVSKEIPECFKKLRDLKNREVL